MNFSIISYLNKPYPALEERKVIVRFSFMIGLFIFLFLYIFKPFYIKELKDDQLYYAAGYGLVTSLTVLFVNLILFVGFRKLINTEKWKLKHSLFRSLFIIIFISVTNWLFDFCLVGNLSKNHSLFEFMMYTLAVGVFPVMAVLVISEKRLLKRHRESAAQINSYLSVRDIPNRQAGETISFTSEITKEYLLIHSSKLLSVKAEGNYSSFCFVGGDGNIQKKLLRIPLRKVENQLSGHENFIRCHRSYIANFDNVVRISGNARNINLHFTVNNYSVPVSRSKEKTVGMIFDRRQGKQAVTSSQKVSVNHK